MYNLKSLIGIAALVAMVGAPLGAAHMDETAWAGAGSVTLPSTANSNENRVSGVYYGSVSALASHTGDPAPVTGNETSFEFGTAAALCDMEILSDGSTVGAAEDEPEVDGQANTAGASTLFNDGGVGAVCHTQTGYYAHADFNTATCDYEPAMGQDATGDVWLTTVCSYAHTVSGTGLLTYFADCVSGAALTVSPLEVVDPCATTTVDCLVNGDCTSLADEIACGPDAAGNADIQVAGQSGWGSAGVAFPAIPSPCIDADAAAVVFVWNAVFVDSTIPNVTGTSTATVGVIF